MGEFVPDPFASLITAKCHVTTSQQHLFRTAPLHRQLDRFPDDSESQYQIPVETDGIQMESLLDDVFLTPQEDSLPPASSSDGESVPPINYLLDFLGPPLAAAVDLGRDSDSLGFGVRKSTVVIDSGDLGRDTDEFMVIENETRQMRREVWTDSKLKKFRVSEGLEAFKGTSVGTVVIDLGGDQLFDKIPVKNPDVNTGPSESTNVKAADSVDDHNFLVRKQGLNVGLSENTNIETVDLDEDCDLPAGEQGSKIGPIENISTQVVDLDEGKVCSNLPVTNTEVELGDDESISTEVVDLEENETCDGLPIRNKEAEMLCTENASTEVADVDEDELCGNLTTRNLVGEVGLSESDEVFRDVNIGLSKQVGGTKGDENRQKGVGIGDENTEFEKRVEEIEKLKPISRKCISIGESSEMCSDLHTRNLNVENALNKGDEVCRGGNREFSHEGVDLPKVDDIRQKGTCELPSSLRKVANITLNKGDTNKESKRESFENNRNKIDRSNCGGQNRGGMTDLPSTISEETKSNEIMKNLLDALDLISGGEKEKADDDVSDKNLDFWETAMMRGMKFVHPKWWPTEEPDD